MKRLLLFTLLITSCRKNLSTLSKEVVESSYAEASSRPNIIFILMDDVGYEVPTADGGRSYETPNIDALAKSGVRFTQCHALPLCSPSRVEVMTGKYNFRNYTGWAYMDRSNKTFGNMLKDAGYATGVFGKWQLGGGDTSIKAFGFDQYIVHDPTNESQKGTRYKTPHLYTHGSFIPYSATQGQYGEDIVSDSLLEFISNNTAAHKPFFGYYTMILSHTPFQPTPDDPAYKTFVSGESSDSIWYRPMIKYMDKMIGKVIAKVNELGIAGNTVIILAGDNGTPEPLHSLFRESDGTLIWMPGTKGSIVESAYHVPLIVNWSAHIAPKIDSSTLVDFTDLLPTLADIARIAKPTDYGTLDGVSFYDNLMHIPGKNRDYIFCDFNPYPELHGMHFKWIQGSRLKKYNKTLAPSSKIDKLYDILKHPTEDIYIPISAESPYEITRTRYFDSIMSAMY